jgi:hypothetical protein
MTPSPDITPEATAARIVGQWYGAWPVNMPDHPNAKLIAAIANAIKAERESCATDAAIHSRYPIETDWERGYATGRKDAAAAIRGRL